MSFFLFYFLILAIAGIMLLKERANQRNEDRGIVDINNVVNFMEEFQDDEKTIDDKPLKVEIKEGQVDVNKIIEYKGKNIKKFEFRPYNFETFIGQREAKERVKIAIKKIERGLRGHIFIDGRQGTGKTTFINILAKMLKAKLISRVGKQVDADELTNIINEITTCPEKNVVFFCDEMDSMDKKVIKMLNPLIEEFLISGKKVKPFVFCGASIQKSTLLKHNPDTMDRIQSHLKFERYNTEELEKIISQYTVQLFPTEKLTEKDIRIISQNCKYTPRIAIALAEELIIVKDIKKVLSNWKIIKNGLTEIDIRILRVLNKLKRPIGSNALAQRCKLTELEYVREYEGFLCEEGYVLRVPSRIIGENGKKFLKELKKEV